jgi:hypothetical protein
MKAWTRSLKSETAQHGLQLRVFGDVAAAEQREAAEA